MTSSIDDNRCKLLLLDLDSDQMNDDKLKNHFVQYGPIQSIEIFPKSSSAVIQFTDPFPVDRLVQSPTCCIGDKSVRMRRFRRDPLNAHLDCYTIHVKSTSTALENNSFTEESLRHCFRQYQSFISSLDILSPNQALISFRKFDYVDQIFLTPSNTFMINGFPLHCERIITKINRKSRWDQPSQPLTTVPILSVRNPLLHKLISHIEYLTKQLREQPSHCQDEIQRLEAEVFILKNENALLKSKEKSSNKTNRTEKTFALTDISNRLENKSNNHRRGRSPSTEKYTKRRRPCPVSENRPMAH